MDNQIVRNIDFGVTNNLDSTFSHASENIFIHEENSTTYAGGGNDLINGSSGNDRIDGQAGDDEIFAKAGDDVIKGGAGNDFIDGGDGIDEAQFEGNKENFELVRNLDGITLKDISRSGNQEIDSLKFVEKLKFKDQLLDFSSAPQAAGIGDFSVDSNEYLEIELAQYFTDSDASDILVYDAQGLPDGLTIDSYTGKLSGIVSSDNSGSYDIIARASDIANSTASAEFTLAVSAPGNSPPTWGSPTYSVTSNLAQEGETFSFTMGATDVDGINGSISTHWIIEKEGVQTEIHTGDTYLIQETDIGGQILVKQSYTDNLGNFHESSLFSLATPVVAYSNSPANFDISLASGEYSVGEIKY